jgi:hypothetical protein
VPRQEPLGIDRQLSSVSGMQSLSVSVRTIVVVVWAVVVVLVLGMVELVVETVVVIIDVVVVIIELVVVEIVPLATFFNVPVPLSTQYTNVLSTARATGSDRSLARVITDPPIMETCFTVPPARFSTQKALV